MEKLKVYLEKLRNLSDNQKKSIIIVTVIILGLILGGFWVNSAVKKVSDIKNSVNLPFLNLPSLKITDTTTKEKDISGDKTTDWKTYTNEKYGFEIKYPSDWTFRQYISGATFFPESKSEENKTGNGIINIGFYSRGQMYCKIPFEDYVKVAAVSEIQNYESLNTIEAFVGADGAEIYKTTWNYKDMKGNQKISLPITYFKTNNECGSIEAFLNNADDLDIYSQIISTFKFIK